MSKQLTPEQQKALEHYKKTGEMGILENILIEDCEKAILESPEVEERYNKTIGLIPEINQSDNPEEDYIQYHTGDGIELFLDLHGQLKVVVVLGFLSSNPDGTAVMPFLDVKTDPNTIKDILIGSGVPIYLFSDILLSNLLTTLYFTFTYLLFAGGSVEKALETIAKIYIETVYAN